MPKDPKNPVITEDLDAIERRRLKGEARSTDPKASSGTRRRLLSYCLPFRGKLVLGFLLASFSAVSAALALFLLEGILQPIINSQEPASRTQLGLMILGHASTVTHSFWGWGAAASAALSTLWAAMLPTTKLAAAALTFSLLSVCENISKYVQRLTMRTVSIRIVQQMRTDLYRKFMDLSMKFYQANHSGKLMSRLTGDLGALGKMLVDVTVTVFTDTFALIGTLVFLWVRGGVYVLYGVGILAILFVPVRHIAQRVRRKEHQGRTLGGEMISTLSEALQGQKVVKTFGAEDFEADRFGKLNEATTQVALKTTKLRARTGPIVDVIGSGGMATIMWFGGMQVIAGGWAPETFMAILFGLAKTVGAIRRLGNTSNHVSAGLAATDRVSLVLYSEAEIRDTSESIPCEGLSQKIAFDKVSYSYDGVHSVLNDLSFDLPVGTTAAFVGPTGAGKSTVGDLLSRFYDVDSGLITIDDTDIKSFTVQSLRSQIAVVSQDTVLFEDTVANNIAYGLPGTPQEQIISAARSAHADDFIQKLPQGYDTMLGERGSKLSGGERQRLSIARAILKDAPILILDEATSSLDSQSEKIVQEALSELMKGRTTLIIAHRLSTIRGADQILYLKDGKIVEQGTHEELLGADSQYARMHQLQTQA